MAKVPSFGPKCPNHAVTLVDLPFPLTPKRMGVCPISSCRFDYEVELDETEMVRNSDGTMSKKVGWKVSGDDK